jgi:hypothetical protein
MAYNVARLSKIYYSVRGNAHPRADFIKAAVAMGVKNTTAAGMWNSFKTGKGSYKLVGSPSAVQEQISKIAKANRVVETDDKSEQGKQHEQTHVPDEQVASSTSVPIQEINVADISSKSQGEMPESKDLSSTYQKMLENATEGEGTTSSGDSGIGESEEAEEVETTTLEGSTDQNKVRLRKLWAVLATTLNDGLLWRERPLNDDEKALINESSDNLSVQFLDEMAESEYGGWYVYALYGFVVPAVARIDLLIDKVKSVFPQAPQQKPGMQFYTPDNAPGKQKVQEPLKQQSVQSQAPKPLYETMDLTSNQKMFIQNMLASGYKISPNYNPEAAFDRDAYTRGIIRNVRDNWQG